MTGRVVAAATLGPHEGAVERLATAGCEIDRLPAGATAWTAALIAQFAPTADAYLGTWRGLGLPRAVLAASPRLRVITSPIIGTEYIDVEAATALGVVVAHGAMPENFDGMAEAGVMLIAAARKALAGKMDVVRRGEWKTAASGRLVQGSTVGLLGFGRIGRGVAQRLRGWGCEILATDPYIDPTVADELDVRLVELDDLLQRADVLVVLVTLTPETRHIIDTAALARMKSGAALINIGRGGCVDEDAVLTALESGRLGAAAVDTWEQEPPPADHPLRRHPAVIATAHDVGHSRELYAAIPAVAAENTLAALAGREPTYVRNASVLPAWRARLKGLSRESTDV